LLGIGDSLGALGQPSAAALSLTAASVAGPIGALVALLQAARPMAARRSRWRLAAALLLLALAALLASVGWLPLMTWRA
jgi:hypothetical protein